MRAYARQLSSYRGARGKLDPSRTRKVINLRTTSGTLDANWYDSRSGASISPLVRAERSDTAESLLIGP